MSRFLHLRLFQFDVDPISNVKLLNNLNEKKNVTERTAGSFDIF